MAIATNALKETLSTAYGTAAAYMSMHTADPGTTGTSEVTGGSPAYARKALVWTPGSSDGVNTAASVTFDLPISTAVTHVGIWSAVTAGTFLDKAVCAVASQSSQATVTVNPITFTQS
jgi:hypothetical protein